MDIVFDNYTTPCLFRVYYRTNLILEYSFLFDTFFMIENTALNHSSITLPLVKPQGQEVTPLPNLPRLTSTET